MRVSEGLVRFSGPRGNASGCKGKSTRIPTTSPLCTIGASSWAWSTVGDGVQVRSLLGTPRQSITMKTEREEPFVYLVNVRKLISSISVAVLFPSPHEARGDGLTWDTVQSCGVPWNDRYGRKASFSSEGKIAWLNWSRFGLVCTAVIFYLSSVEILRSKYSTNGKKCSTDTTDRLWNTNWWGFPLNSSADGR